MSVPKLRFKDENGQDFPDWEEKELGEIFDIVVGFVGTVSKFYCDKSDGIQFIRTLNVKDGYFSLDDIQYVTKEFHIKNRKSQINNEDILIARVGANMGMVCKVQGLKSEANSANVIIIRSSLTNNSEFYACYLRSSKGQKQIQAKGAGGAQEVLNISVTKTITVPVPILMEQTKIADFLMAVDKKIAQLTQKCELLARYKKGVMQQIFSQELRFKDDDGSDFPDWEKDSLLNLSKSGFTNGVFNDPSKVGSGYKLINVLDMYIDSTIDDTKLNLVELSEDEFNRNKVKYGDTFFTRSSLVKEGIAHSNIYLGMKNK